MAAIREVEFSSLCGKEVPIRSQLLDGIVGVSAVAIRRYPVVVVKMKLSLARNGWIQAAVDIN